MAPNFLPPELQIENDAINRRRQLANALLQQGLQVDQGQNVGGWYVRPSPLQGLAKMFQVYAGIKGGKDADEQSKELVQRHGQMTQDWISSAPRPVMQEQELAGPTQGGAPLTGQQTVNPTQQDMMQWAMKGMNVNPQIAGSMVKQYMQGPNANIAHLDPGKYTEESIGEYQRTGNPWVLRPRTTPTSELNARIQRSQIEAKLFQWANLSAQQRALLSKEIQEYNLNREKFRFESGIEMPPMEIPQGSVPTPTVAGPTDLTPPGQAPATRPAPAPGPLPAPQPAPVMGGAPAPIRDDQAPSWAAAYDAIRRNQQAGGRGGTIYYSGPEAPQTIPYGNPPTVAPPGPVRPPLGAVPPKGQAEAVTAAARLQAEANAKREFNMGGLSDVIDEAARTLSGRGQTIGGVETTRPMPTQSGIGTVMDSAASLFGIAPKGAAEADRLKVISGVLVSKMPRMEGPQSNLDVELYKEMAGRVGDSTLPVARRLEALDTVRKLYAKYDRQAVAAPAAGAPATPAALAPGQVLRFDARGNPIQ